MKELDIILPVFNDARVLNTIKSIKDFDDLNNTRIIIINGSTDASLSKKIIKIIRKQDLLINEKDYGLFDALNKGLLYSTSPYIGWIGADDYFTGQIRSSNVSSDLHNFDIVIYNTLHVRSGRIKRKSYAKLVNYISIFIGINNPHFSTFIKRSYLPPGLFRTDLLSSDIDFFLKLFAMKPKLITHNIDCTVMELGGFSNKSFYEIFKRNFELIKVYQQYSFIGFFSPIIKILYKLIASAIIILKK